MLPTGKAVVVFSGGQDSTTCLGYALDKFGPENVYCLTFDYGQRHAREIEATRQVISFFEYYYDHAVKSELVQVGDHILRGSSPLLKGGEELERYESAEQMEAIIGDRVEKTFVPMRNSLFLTIAANRAVLHGARTIITGVCEGDNANYPDCRSLFIDAVQLSINESLGLRGDDEIRIDTPLILSSKADTVRTALSLPFTFAALAWSHTAYDGAYPPLGGDHASVLRAKGFLEADMPDPLILRAVHEGLMEMPKEQNYRELLATNYTEAMKGMWK